jgi:hypothetical protein
MNTPIWPALIWPSVALLAVIVLLGAVVAMGLRSHPQALTHTRPTVGAGTASTAPTVHQRRGLPGPAAPDPAGAPDPPAAQRQPGPTGSL